MHARLLAILAAICLSVSAAAQPETSTGLLQNRQTTLVTVRWGARTGVSRYRLQVAQDRDFTDIVFDRVVYGHEYQVTDLQPGKYFWRVAPLDDKLGTFSSAGVIDLSAETSPMSLPTKVSTQNTSIASPPSAVPTRSAWYAAFNGVSKTALMHLRSANKIEIVATTTDGRVVTLDGLTGIALWVRQTNPKTTPLAVPIQNRNGLNDVFVLSETAAILLEGKTGKEIWRGNLPAAISSAVAIGDIVFAIDRSLERAFVINASAAKLVSDVRLSGRVVGSPVITNLNGSAVAVAFADGRLQILDATGKFIRTGDAGAPVTTAPLFVRTPRGEFVLVGTRHALTALTAEDLRPLGRATLKDSPQGSLFAEDLDQDGAPEVVLFTDSGRVVVLKSDEGKVIWEADAKRAEAASFADVNSDHVVDLLMMGREGSAFALSGRDGTMIWKDESSGQILTNHAPAVTQRTSLVVSSGAGVLFIATDAGNAGLRALELPKAVAPRN